MIALVAVCAATLGLVLGGVLASSKARELQHDVETRDRMIAEMMRGRS